MSAFWTFMQGTLTSEAFMSRIPSVILLIIAVCILARMLKIKIKTEHIQIGGENRDVFYERKIVREQCDYAHTYLAGLLHKIRSTCSDGELLYCGWFSKYILEDVYDEVVKWITFNHITDDEAYISAKQKKICSLVYTYNVRPEFKTPEFQERMKKWTEELIVELVKIRKLYTKGARKGT